MHGLIDVYRDVCSYEINRELPLLAHSRPRDASGGLLRAISGYSPQVEKPSNSKLACLLVMAIMRVISKFFCFIALELLQKLLSYG